MSKIDLKHRGTFVGTVNFLAPEMISDCEATLATDLWALGCIIFKMYTGKSPFPGMSEQTCFPNILARRIDWPKGMECDTQFIDLVDALLQLKPENRLGSPGSQYDMAFLKKHKFFKGIDFSRPLI